MSKVSGPITAYAEALAAMHALWKPHAVQVLPGKALFADACKRIFMQFGRQTGKSQLMAYMAVRWAIMNPGSRIFIVLPLLKQCRAIYLHSRIIQHKIPPQYLEDIHMTDGRFTFKNGSMIELYGVDNADSFRGLTADVVFVDEAKDISQDALDSVITPTLLVKNAPLVVAGTPPGVTTAYYWTLVQQAQTDPEWRLYRATSYDNPYIAKELLDKERARYQARGEDDTFRREFLAEYVPSQRKVVFPMLTDEDHIRQYDTLMHEIRVSPGRWNYHVIMDPGTASVFAVLLAAINAYDGRIRLLDEVYANQQSETSIGQVWPKVATKMKEIYDEDPGEGAWAVTYDEAGLWAANELRDRFDINAMPTQKYVNKKGAGISAVKDVLVSKHMIASDRLVQWKKEMQAYEFDDRGAPIKKNDHLVDCTLYLLPASYYTAKETAPPHDPPKPTPGQIDDPRRAYRPEDDAALSGINLIGDEYLFDALDMDYD